MPRAVHERPGHIQTKERSSEDFLIVGEDVHRRCAGYGVNTPDEHAFPLLFSTADGAAVEVPEVLVVLTASLIFGSLEHAASTGRGKKDQAASASVIINIIPLLNYRTCSAEDGVIDHQENHRPDYRH